LIAQLHTFRLQERNNGEVSPVVGVLNGNLERNLYHDRLEPFVMLRVDLLPVPLKHSNAEVNASGIIVSVSVKEPGLTGRLQELIALTLTLFNESVRAKLVFSSGEVSDHVSRS
jgi:hypothetical protein